MFLFLTNTKSLTFRHSASLVRQFDKYHEIVQTKTDDETDTESELPLNDHPKEESNKPTAFLRHSSVTTKIPDNIANEAGAAYSTVVQELKTITKKMESESDESAKEMVAKIASQRMKIFQSKSALKSQPLASVMRKKVLFDLESEKKSADEKPQIVPRTNEGGGSTTSIASSVFDGSKAHAVDVQKSEAKVHDKRDSDISDWDISEVLN